MRMNYGWYWAIQIPYFIVILGSFVLTGIAFVNWFGWLPLIGLILAGGFLGAAKHIADEWHDENEAEHLEKEDQL